MKKLYIYLIGLVCFSGFGQTETTNFERPNYAPKTPEAAAFLKYGEYPVDLSTGVPNISIPIYTIEDNGFKIPISLDYHASGIKVTQEATWVGLGWNLNFGAQIILSPQDDIDENNPYIDNAVDEDDVDDYFDQHPYQFQGGMVAQENLDRSRVKDFYVFSSPTASGSFYIKDLSDGIIVTIPPQAFKVETIGATRDNLRFKITDAQGNIYFFNTREISARTGTHSNYYTSAWYVSQIKTASNSTIDFTYQSDGSFNEYTFNQRIDITDWATQCGCQGEGEAYGHEVSPIITEGGSVMTNGQKIHEISFNNGNSKVVFSKLNGREDLIDGNDNGKLDKISIQNLEEGAFATKKEYSFEYTYFESTTGAPLQPYMKKRLKLDRMESGEGERHEFIYSSLYVPLKSSLARDHFGYYNNSSSTNLIPKHFFSEYSEFVGTADRKVNPLVNQFGMLTEIRYPTKGWTKFEYETNQYYGVDPFRQNDDITVSASVSGTGTASQDTPPPNAGPTYPNCHTPASDGCHHQSTTTFQAINGTGTLHCVLSHNLGSNPTVIKYRWFKIRLYVNGILVHDSYSRGGHSQINDYYINNIPLNGNCELVVDAYGSDMSANATMIYTNNYSTPQNTYGGGLRIKNINNFDHSSDLATKKEYSYIEPENPTRTSGALLKQSPVTYTTPRFKNLSILLCLQDYSTRTGVNYTIVQSINSNSTTAMESNSISYEYVKEKTINVQDTLQSFYSDYKFSFYRNHDFFGNGTIEVAPTWKRGKMLERKDYKIVSGSAYPLRKETNTYVEDTSKISFIDGFKFFRRGNLAVSEEPDPMVIPCNFCLHQGLCQMPSTVRDLFEIAGIHSPIPWFYLKQTNTEEYFYDQANNLIDSLSTNKTYYHDNPQHLQLTRQSTKNSKGQTLETKYSYAEDASMSAEPQVGTLVAQHMIGIPLKVESFNGSTKLAEKKTIYAKDSTTANILLPKIIQTSKGSGVLETEITYEKYDSDGTLIQYRIKNGMVVTLLWDYNNVNVVAKIENMAYENIPSGLISALKLASQSGHEAPLFTALNNLRTDPAMTEAMVTTYTYDYLIGVSSITDPKGIITHYKYDGLGRLIEIKDADGHLLKENQYYFKN